MSTSGRASARRTRKLSWRSATLLAVAGALLTPAIAPLKRLAAPSAQADSIDWANLTFDSLDDLKAFLSTQRRELAAAQQLARDEAKAADAATVAGINARFDDEVAVIVRDRDDVLARIEEERASDVAAYAAEHERAVAELDAWYATVLPSGPELRDLLRARRGTSGLKSKKLEARALVTRSRLVDTTTWPCDAERPECDRLLLERFWKWIDTTPGMLALLKQQKAELAALKSELKAELAVEAARMGLADDLKAQYTALENEGTQALAELEADHERRLAELVRELAHWTGLRDDDLATLAARHRAELAELTAARATRSELAGARTRQAQEALRVTQSYADPIANAESQIAAEETTFTGESAALAARYTTDLAAMSTAHKALLDALKADVKTVQAVISTLYEGRQEAMGLRHTEERARARGQFLRELDAATIDALRFSRAMLDGLIGRYEAQFVELRNQRRSAIDGAFKDATSVQNRRAKGAGDTERNWAKALIDDVNRRRGVALDEQKREASFAALKLAREQARTAQLLEADLYRLQERVRSHLDAATLAPLASYYDPLTDEGSLYNVANRIRLPAGATGAGVTVALIDTGVTDVAGLRNTNVILGPDFSLESQAENLRQRDTNGHGTHLAGIIAAADTAWRNGDTVRRPDRVLGVAPDANLLAIKTGAANGAVDVTQILAAISWVIQNKDAYNIRVVNLSFGTDGVQDYQVDPLSFAVEQAWRAGIVVVVAAGNDGDTAASLTNPATNPYVIAVGASEGLSDRQSIAAPYSSAGGQRVPDIWAPGRSIVSLRNPGSFSDTENGLGRTGDSLVRGSGSSQAAAVVSGAVALLLQQRPTLTPDQVKQLLTSTSDAGTGPVPARFLRIDKALARPTPTTGYEQTWPAAAGTGTLDGARGSVRLIADDTPLTGERDIFGLPWTRDAWADGSWLHATWTGGPWPLSAWTAEGWSGSTWNRSAWTTGLWTASVWTRSAWTAEGWNGRSWTGDTWVRSAWTDAGWVRSAWSDAGWVRSAWSADGWVRSAWTSDAWAASGWVRSAWSEADPG